jgi:hypothetical protein
MTEPHVQKRQEAALVFWRVPPLAVVAAAALGGAIQVLW